MVGTDEYDDDYVARLLAEDAKKTSQKYSSQGLSAFLPQRRAVDAPKPNTRFLSHIVREADSHNAALKRKEQVEAKKRLRELHGEDEPQRKRIRADETTDSKRSRLLKDIVSAANSENKTRHRHRDSSRRAESRHTIRNDSAKDFSRDKPGKRERDHRSSRTARRRSSSPEPHRKDQTESSQIHPRRKSKERRHDHDEGGDDKLSSKSISGFYGGANERLNTNAEENVHKRGRGALRKSSGIDDRFEKGYDPSQDVSLDSDGDTDAQDWNMALEAMRDRAKWKRNQAVRMREAGFDEKDITKWAKGSLSQNDRTSDLTDVKWSRKGEVREWDAGKVQP